MYLSFAEKLFRPINHPKLKEINFETTWNQRMFASAIDLPSPNDQVINQTIILAQNA